MQSLAHKITLAASLVLLTSLFPHSAAAQTRTPMSPLSPLLQRADQNSRAQARSWADAPMPLKKILVQLRPPTPVTVLGSMAQPDAELIDSFRAPRELVELARGRVNRFLAASEISARENIQITPTVIVTPPDHWGEDQMQGWMDQVLDQPDVLAIERDQVYLPNDTFPWGITQMGSDRAWVSVTPRDFGAGVKVAILDSGATLDHPDLRYAGGYDVLSGSTNPAAWADTLASCRGHGTHIAGTIAALDNGIGIVGVAPEADVYAVRIFQDLFGSCLTLTSSQVAGINWAANNSIRVMNMSFGGPFSSSIAAALANATAQGVIPVASAGNEASSVGYPGRDANAIAVAASNSSDAIASFSNFGPEVLVAAPGESVYSTLPGGTYGTKSGTSMAAPHVVGLVAL